MESSQIFQIDTSSTNTQSKQQNINSENLSEEELLIKKIINPDEDFDEHVSALELINHFSKYQNCLEKYDITAEELFERLHLKNQQIEEYSESPNQLSESQNQLDILALIQNFNKSSINYIRKVPLEIIILCFSFLDVKSLVRTSQVCKEWQKLSKEKAVGKLYKQNCLIQWDKEQYTATQQFLSKFQNWRHMMKTRPLLRFDGFYVCKLLYKRQGLSDRSWNHPVFEVISYKYLRFFPDGKMLSLYTNTAPKRFLPKIKQHLNNLQVSQEQSFINYQLLQNNQIQLQSGTYQIHNDWITMKQMIQATEYKNEFQMFRNSALPHYLQEGDYLDLYWSGFKIDPDQVESNDDYSNYIPIKVNNHNPNKFKFKQVSDLPQ